MKPSEEIDLLKNKIKALEDALEKRRPKISLKTIFSSRAVGKTGGAVSIALLSKLIDSSVDGIVAADKEGNLLVFNEAASAMYGHTVETALSSLNIRDLYPESGAYEVMAKLRSDDYGGPGKLAGHLVNVRDKSGQVFPVRMNASIVYEKDQEIATIGYLRDLREDTSAGGGLPAPTASPDGAGDDMSLDEYLTNVNRQLQLYDQRFCVGAVKNDLATLDQVKRALLKQTEITEKTKVHVPIGRIMIQLGILTEVQRDAIVSLFRMEDRKRASGSRADKGPRLPAASGDSDEAGKIEDIVTLTVSDDRLEATIHMTVHSGLGVTATALIDFIKGQGIGVGIVDETDVQNYLEAGALDAEPLIIARGQPMVPETPPEARFHFSTDPLGVGTAREDGSIDWKNRGRLPQAKSGDVLADVFPGSPGVGGRDVFGNEIVPPTVKAALPKCGKGVALSENGDQYVATLTGMPFLEDNKLSVLEIFVVNGDVGLETGHIDFDGHVEVNGSIHSGYRVSCKSLRVEDVHEAEVTIVGDMAVMGGVYDSTVRCRGGLQASQIRKSRVSLGRDLLVQKEIMESDIESSGQCLIEDGTVIFSRISAKDGVIAGNLGTKGSKPSTLFVGIDKRMQREIKYTKNKLELQKKDLERLPGEIDELEETLQTKDVEKTDLAKTLSCHDERIDDIQKQLQMLEAGNREADAEKVRKIVANLKSERKRIHAHLQSIDRDMEKMSERAIQKYADVEKGQEELKLLEEKLDALIAERAGHRQGAMVQVSGSVLSGTTITGPRASITLNDDVASLVIREVNQVDGDGNETAVMQMSGLD